MPWDFYLMVISAFLSAKFMRDEVLDRFKRGGCMSYTAPAFEIGKDKPCVNFALKNRFLLWFRVEPAKMNQKIEERA